MIVTNENEAKLNLQREKNEYKDAVCPNCGAKIIFHINEIIEERKENWSYGDRFNSNPYYKYIDCPICESTIFESEFKEHNYDEYIVED